MCCPETGCYSERIRKPTGPELIRVGRLPPANIEGVILEPACVCEDCKAVFMEGYHEGLPLVVRLGRLTPAAGATAFPAG
jgi:hypothetical protein